MLAPGFIAAIPLVLGVGTVLREADPGVAVDLRGESRVRPAGHENPDAFASGEVEIRGGLEAGLRLSPISLGVGYSPSITFTSYDPLSEPLLLHQAMARLYVEAGSGLRLSAAHVRQQGERNFTAALIHEEEGGRRLRLEFLPDIERLEIESHYTNLGGTWHVGRRTEHRFSGGYGSFGGRGEWARQRLPKQSGPVASIHSEVGVSARDAALIQARAARTVFDPGPTFRIGELEGGWRRQRGRRTSLAGLLGVFAGYNEEPLGSELRSVVLPTLRGELTHVYSRGRPDAELEVSLSAAPRINQLYATLDPRVTAEAALDWSWLERVGGLVEIGHAFVLSEDFSLDGQLTAMSGRVTFPVTSLLELEGGVRLFRQKARYGVGWWGPASWRWDLFTALALRSDLLGGR